jgi:glycosyltransferase involved in cell wall biosynthesis
MTPHPKTCLMLLDNPYLPDHRPRREIETLAAAGWRIVMLCEKGEGLPEMEVQGSVEIHRIDAPWQGLMFSMAATNKKVQTIAFIEKRWPAGFHVVHCHDWLTLPFGKELASAIGARLVYDAHEYFAGTVRKPNETLKTRLRRRLRLWRESRALRHVDLLVTVSPMIINWFRDRCGFRKRVLLLTNKPDWMLPLEPYDRLRLDFGIPPESLILVHAGNIRFNTRRVDIVIEALKTMPDCHLLCVGDGEHIKLKELALSAGVADRVHHMPAVPFRELGNILAACDIGVSLLQQGIPNLEAALPNKLFEYLAAGLPVLSSPATCQDRFISDEGVGWVMSALTRESCSAALHQAKNELAVVRQVVLQRRSLYVWGSQEKSLVQEYADFSRNRQSPD